MTETFEKQILDKLGTMEKSITSLKSEVDHIMEYIEDSKLTQDEKKLLEGSLKDKKEGELLSSEEVFG